MFALHLLFKLIKNFQKQGLLYLYFFVCLQNIKHKNQTKHMKIKILNYMERNNPAYI